MDTSKKSEYAFIWNSLNTSMSREFHKQVKRQTNLIQVLTDCMVLGKFSGNLHIVSLERTHQNMCNAEKKSPSHRNREVQSLFAILGLLVSKTDEEDVRGTRGRRR